MLDLSVRGQRVKFLKSLASRARRIRSGKFLVEGPQAVRELVAHRSQDVVDIYVGKQAKPAVGAIAAQALDLKLNVHEVDISITDAISSDNQGIVAVSNIPTVPELPDTARHVVWLSQVRDPGNLGTIIRTADAAGVDAVVLSKDSADIYNPKVVRASAGSLFHIPVVTGVEDETVFDYAATNGLQVWAMTGHGKDNLYDLESNIRQSPRVWLFGNEARGLDQSLIERADRQVYIPIYGLAESLNLSISVAVCVYATTGQNG